MNCWPVILFFLEKTKVKYKYFFSFHLDQTDCCVFLGDQLSCIIELLGMPPQKLLDQSKRAKNFISSKGIYEIYNDHSCYFHKDQIKLTKLDCRKGYLLNMRFLKKSFLSQVTRDTARQPPFQMAPQFSTGGGTETKIVPTQLLPPPQLTFTAYLNKNHSLPI